MIPDARVRLSQLLARGPLELSEGLALAECLADAVQRLHQHGAAHHALNPDHVLVDRLGEAIELVRASGPQSLRYLAPEQTGHLPQPIDQRADLYALGAVLYEIFTGRAPFESTEPIELVHAHLARLPEPPRDLVPGIPPPLSSLIQRLLEKSPDARYQSARGVAQDLQRLRKAWHAGHPLTMLRLGTGDIDRRVRSPKRLVGRDAVLALLMAAYHRVADGATEFVLVTGAAGSGKSALARECQHAVLKRLGYFLTDSTNTRDASDSSYPLAGAMAQLAFKLLTESEASLLQWRETFELALGHDCDVLVQIVPAFEAVLGRRIASRAPSAPSTANRWSDTVCGLLQSITLSGQPLVLFLDDLDAASDATLALLRQLLAEPTMRHLLVIGTSGADPTPPRLLQLAQAPTVIRLAPLSSSEIEATVREFLHQQAVDVSSIAQQLVADGHLEPGAIRNALEHWIEKGILRLDERRECWIFELCEPETRLECGAPSPSPPAAAALDASFDLITFLEAARAIAGEIELPALLERLMRLALEIAGAGRGALILEEAGRWLIEAEAEAIHDPPEVRLLEAIPLDASASVSASMVSYVLRTGELLLVDDASTDSRFAQDAYVRAGQPHAALCVPIVARMRLLGALYLENNLTRAAFASNRVQLVSLIAAQAAISLENARLVAAMRAEIDQRVRAEARIREQALLLDRANDAIIVIDTAERIRYWNHGAERLYGWPAQDAYASTVAALFGADDAPAAEARQAAVAQGDWSGELTRPTRDGRAVIVHSRATPLFEHDGTLTGILVIDSDVTERKAIEANLLRAQRLQAIGTLASGVAHDLNNVLTPVMMAVDTLASRESDSTKMALLKMIRSNTERGAGVIGQLLTFARGNEGKRERLNPAELIVEIERIINETFPRTIRFACALASDIAAIDGDPTQLHQVLLNLALNARDAMPDGGTLTIDLKNILVDPTIAQRHAVAVGAYVAFIVRDTGIGIAPEVLDKLFEPFFTTKGPGGGTGLGLASVAGIVKSHKGFVTVDSQAGAGSTFVACFPAAATTRRASLPMTTSQGDGNGQTLLVVDDELAVRQSISLTLEQHGYRVMTAANVREALAIFDRHGGEIDAVLTDVMMPEQSGAALLAALERRGVRIPILAMSGLPLASQSDDARAFAHHTLLLKPFDAATLIAAIAAALRPPRGNAKV